MRFTTIAVFFLFACLAHADNRFTQALAHIRDSSPSKLFGDKTSNTLAEVDPSMTQRFIANANFALAQKFGHGGFKVYKPKSTYYFNVGEERLTAVVKVIPSAKIADIEKEVKKWTRDGTLLAYATSGRTTSLILKVKTPEWGDHPPSVQEKTALMHKAIVQAPDYGYEWVVHIGAYEENFVWGRAKGDPKGKWRAEIVDWARDWSEK